MKKGVGKPKISKNMFKVKMLQPQSILIQEIIM